MATKVAHKRLTREYAALQSSPPPYIIAHPSEANILEWHYLIEGAPDTPYVGGQYWGTLVFPPEYPFAPPAIRMHTPSGRFQTSTRLCLSISDFHPESFNPAWSVSTILIGLMILMNSEEKEMALGSLSASLTERKWHTARSRWWNSTGGGSASTPNPGNIISKHGASINDIKAGDGGTKFRSEWPDEDKKNWEWIQENRIGPGTGKAIPDPEGEAVHYGGEAAKLRKILGAAGGSDVIAISKLIITITREPGESNDVAFDYQSLVAELRALLACLQRTDQIHPTRPETSQIAQIRDLAAACAIRIQTFSEKMEAFEPYLEAVGVTVSKWRIIRRRVRWQMKYKEEARELRLSLGPLELQAVANVDYIAALEDVRVSCQDQSDGLDGLTRQSSGVGESALDMRKPLDRDKDRRHVRENGRDFKVFPEDAF